MRRLAEAIEQSWDTARFEQDLQAYATQTRDELLSVERLVSALYTSLNDFEVFTSLTMLYFTAVSYSETARRLGRPQLAESFFLYDDPGFGAESRLCLERIKKHLSVDQKTKLIRQIQHTIEPVNVAGLANPDRRNWYPVDAEDLLKNAGKLGVGKEEIEQLLNRSGFSARDQIVNLET